MPPKNPGRIRTLPLVQQTRPVDKNIAVICKTLATLFNSDLPLSLVLMPDSGGNTVVELDILAQAVLLTETQEVFLDFGG